VGHAPDARRLETLVADAPSVLGVNAPGAFRAIENVAVPLLASVAGAVIFAAVALERDGWAPAFLRGGSWLILGVAFWTFLWAYGVLQLGLGRLGREHVRLDTPRVDPSLGLRPFGGAAFMGLWMLLVWLVPVLLTGLPDVVGVMLGMLVLGCGLGFFALALLRLHRQMVEVKARELAIARELYAQAYEPVWRQPPLESLERQQGLMGAATTLETRAKAIDEWPIGEATFAWVVGLTTSILAMTLGRMVVTPLGL
jgi:hypothetical protein